MFSKIVTCVEKLTFTWQSLLRWIGRIFGRKIRTGGRSLNLTSDCAVAFLDLLGFGKAVEDDAPAAAGLLQDYGVALGTAIQDEKIHPPKSYPSQAVRQLAERSSVTSFQFFLPMSDSVFIVADDPSSLVFQVSRFIVDSIWPNIEAFAFPEGSDPRAVTVKHFSIGRDGIKTSEFKEHWLPVLFRGGLSWGRVCVYDAPALVEGKPTHRQNLMGEAVVEAVKLERAGAKGPMMLCTERFASEVAGEARGYLGQVDVAGTKASEICWPVALFETSKSLHDALLNEFGRLLRAAVNLWRYFAGQPVEAHYIGFVKLMVRSALLRFPDERLELQQYFSQLGLDAALTLSFFANLGSPVRPPPAAVESTAPDKGPRPGVWKNIREPGMRLLAWLVKPINRLTMRRWLDIVVLGLLASAVCSLLSPILSKVTRGSLWLLEYLWYGAEGAFGANCTILGLPPAFVVCLGVLFLAISLIIALLIRLGAIRLRNVGALLLYPPVWVAAIWPVTVAAWLFPGLRIVEGEAGWWCGALLLSSFVMTSLLLTSSLNFPAVGRSIQGFASLLRQLKWGTWPFDGGGIALPTAEETLKNFAEDPAGRLIPWLMSDKAVTRPEEDLFESHQFAERIAELITSGCLGPVGLIGPWGSGKTTVLKLVDFLLRSKSFNRQYRKRWREQYATTFWWKRVRYWRQRRSPPRIFTCSVEAWGFVKESAAAVVLREAVAELSKHVDCLSVRSLPREYIAAIKGLAPAWVHAPLMVASGESPSEQLKRLDRLLAAIGARLVVFIEDLDRNIEAPDVAFTQSVKNEGNNIRSEIRNDLAARPNGHVSLEIESLLDRMADCRHFSFVLAISRSST